MLQVEIMDRTGGAYVLLFRLGMLVSSTKKIRVLLWDAWQQHMKELMLDSTMMIAEMPRRCHSSMAVMAPTTCVIV